MLKKNERNFVLQVQYLVVLCLVIAVTLALFVLFYMNGENSVFAKMISEKRNVPDPIENALNSDSISSEQKQELSSLLAKYDRYLSSGYLTVVNDENPLPDGFQVESFSDLSPNPALQMESAAAAQLELLVADLTAAGYT